MTSVLRHCLVVVSLLVYVGRCGGSRDGHDGLHNYHNRRRTKQMQQRTYHQHHQLQQQQPNYNYHQQQQWPLLLYPQSQVLTSRHPHRQVNHRMPVLLLPTTMSGASSIKRIYTPSTRNFRYITSPARQRPHSPATPSHHNFFSSRFQIPTNLRSNRMSQSPRHHSINNQGLGSIDINDNIRTPLDQHKSKVILKDEPQSDNPVSNPEPKSSGTGSAPAFLDPANFKLQDMELSELQATVDWIDNHVKAKDNDPSAYTGSRVLVLLLREQCFRLQASGDPDIDVFCQRFNSRFRSMLF